MSPTPAIRLDCPDKGELSAFADGRLPDTASSAIAEHLAQCRPCEETLGRLTAESSLVCMLRLAGSASVQLEPECVRMQAAVREIPRRAGYLPDDLSQESTDASRLSTDAPQVKSARGNDLTTVARDALPAKIGRYRIQSILGEGAYGRVYLATDPDLDRQVALKVPKFTSQLGGKAGGPLAEALLREARTAAKLKHPGIVTIYDVGYDDQAGCYVAMEYVEGKSLKQVMAAGKVPHEQAASYIAQAAEAVHCAHKQGLVHRDLKPANLLIDADGNVKVADFGLALFEEEQRKRAGEFAGTLPYCSPEQIRGDVHHLDGRTDIWSLGVILYELLAGRRPFGGDNITDEILHRPPKPLRQQDDSIPPELERICLKCLVSEARARYSSAKDLSGDLRRCFRPDRRWLAIAACAAAGILVFVLGASAAMSSLGGGTPSADSQSPTLQETETAEIPYDVDQVAESLAPLHLFTRAPRPLFPERDQDQFLPKPKREEVFLSSSGYILVGAGRTNSVRYRISVDISKPSAGDGHSQAGLFLGFRSLAEPDTSNCQCVMVRADESGSFLLVRSYFVIKDFGEFGWTVSDQTDLQSVPVQLTRDRDPLEVTVVGGRIRQIHWRRELMPSLIDGPLEHVVATHAVTGEFGVINYSGTASFHNLSFTDIRSSAP
jgi:hypothetical protein